MDWEVNLMKVTYKKPKDENFRYKRWFDNNGSFDIWYKDAVSLYDYQSLDIPIELKMFLVNFLYFLSE